MTRAAPLSFKPHQAGKARLLTEEKGRGARSNVSGRYEKEQRQKVDDGWATPETEPLPPLKTNVLHEMARRVITFNKSPYVGFDRSINPYRGCEHGCIYCFARATHAYMGLSPGLDFETKLFAKPDAEKLLVKELSAKNYQPRAIAIGTNTDPYQPIERRYLIMRGILRVLREFNHPISILTKSDLIIRDLDILEDMAAKKLTRAMVSITTQDKKLARAMEPRATTPARRFEAIRRLADTGVQTGVMTGPMIPGLNDSEMESILEQAHAHGASYAAYTVIRLPLEVSPLFQEWLETFAPDRAARIMRHIRDMNGGRDYDVNWSRSDEIKAPYPQLIGQRFQMAKKRMGFKDQSNPLDLTKFRVPSKKTGQGDLFE